MDELVKAYGPMLLFMLTPIWIPVLAVLVSVIRDAVTPRSRQRPLPIACRRPEPAPQTS